MGKGTPSPVVLLVVLLALLGSLPGCDTGASCGESCSVDKDCEGDLICWGGQCAPVECQACSGGNPVCNVAVDTSTGDCRFTNCTPGVAPAFGETASCGAEDVVVE